MQLRILVFFAALNTIVLAGGFFVLDRLESTRRSTPAKEAKSPAGRPSAQKPNVDPAAQVRTVVVYKTNQFDWSQLESGDYRQYIANLRSVGCPEATIRDIIMTDVMRVYAQRRGQFTHNGREFNYWETNEKRALKHTQLQEKERQLAQINRELPAVLHELLGVNYEREVNRYFVDAAEDDRRLVFLPEDKRAQVVAVRDQFESRRDRILKQAQNGKLTPADAESLRQIDAEQVRALDAVLTSEERQRFELTSSATSDRLRNELVGFNPTEKEFKEIYDRQHKLDEKYRYADLTDDSVRAAKAADQANLDAELAGVLSEQRMTDYNRSKDPDYRALYTFAEQYDLPAGASDTLLEMRRVAESERQKLLDDAQLAPERRNAALKVIQSETERVCRETLGTSFDAFAAGPGAWMRSLGQMAAVEPQNQ